MALNLTRHTSSRLTVEGQRMVGEICRRYGVGEETGLALLDALSHTNGSMAQFNLSELGGSGQWMLGGMTMVGDMFNHGLKARVDGLCTDLSAVLATAPFLPVASPFAGSGEGPGGRSGGQWWPAGLGIPNWQGSQNSDRYAYFAASSRLALDENGTVSVYDTSGFILTGVGQQQSSGYGPSLTFTGPGGIVTVDRLRRVEYGTPGETPSDKPPEPPPQSAPLPVSPPVAVAPNPGDALPSDALPGDALDERLTGTQWFTSASTGTAPRQVTLNADGVLDGDIESARYWAVEDAVLWFYNADGKATARYDRIVRASDGMQIVGTSPPDSGTPVTLRSCAPRTAAPTPSPAPGSAVLEVRLDLCAQHWDFGVKDGAGIATPGIATLGLSPDGGISGSSRPTETSWRLEGSQLVFLHKSGRPTVRFTAITLHDDHWTLSGPSLANERMIYVLRQVP